MNSPHSAPEHDPFPSTDAAPTGAVITEPEGNFVGAALGGSLGAIIGALIWIAVTVATGYLIGYIAFGIGFLAGVGAKIGGGGRASVGLAVVLGLAGAVLGYYGVTVVQVATELLGGWKSLENLRAASALVFAAPIETFFTVKDLLFIGLSGYAAYRTVATE